MARTGGRIAARNLRQTRKFWCDSIAFRTTARNPRRNAASENRSALARLRHYVLRAREFLVSEEGAVLARVLTGIHDDKRLNQMFLERYVKQRRQIQRGIIEDAIASGELKPATDPELLIDMLSGPLFFRWLQGHAPLDRGFAQSIFDKVISAFQLGSNASRD